MKRWIMGALALAACAQAAEQGQQNAIVTNPLALAVGVVNVQYERQVSPNNSLLGRVIVASPEETNVDLSLYEVDLGYRRYLSSSKTFSGAYLTGMGAVFKANAQSKINSEDKANATGFGLLGLVGYRWIADFGLVSELGAGVGFVSLKAESESGDVTVNRDGVVPQIDLNFGWAF